MKPNTYGMKMTGIKKVASDSIWQTARGLLLVYYDMHSGEVFSRFEVSSTSYSVFEDPAIRYICTLTEPTSMQDIADFVWRRCGE